jgi:hypothetical protein
MVNKGGGQERTADMAGTGRAMPDPSYLKNTPETDRLTRMVLDRLMTAYPDAVPQAELAAAIGKSENRVSQYLTRIRVRFRNGGVPLTVEVADGAARLITTSVIR